MADRDRGTCRVCNRSVSLTKKGVLRVHGTRATPGRGMNCNGSGKEPREHLRMGRDYTPADVFRAMGEPVPPVWQAFEARDDV